jgi:hypothetical protein
LKIRNFDEFIIRHEFERKRFSKVLLKYVKNLLLKNFNFDFMFLSEIEINKEYIEIK